MQIKLRNKLHIHDNIGGAAIEFTSLATGTVALTLGTNNVGLAPIDLKTLPPGNYTCQITAARTFADPVGPSLVNAGPPPDRVYRPVTLNVAVSAGGVTSATPTNAQFANVAIGPTQVTVDIQPVWMKSLTNSARGQSIEMIVVHHTACPIGPAVNTFLVEKGPHYMIDVDGQIVKWVQDSRSAAHAGVARWAGHSDINARSIGIEIVHASGTYPASQYASLLDLLTRIRTAFPGIDARSIVGHSDVGTNATGWLGRKSGDPGALFEWQRLEARSLGMLRAFGPPAANIYAGFFQAVQTGSLRRGDSDKHHRFGGATLAAITGAPVKALQSDLAAIGYSVGTPDGDFGERTHHAVVALQEHFFAGGRGHKSPDGRVDFITAGLIKSLVP